MKSVIDHAIGKREERESFEPPPKKRKQSLDVDEESTCESEIAEDFVQQWVNDPVPRSSDDQQLFMLKKQLKILWTNHPNINLKFIEDIDARLNAMTIDEIREKIDNFKMALGLRQPNETAQSILGALGTILEVSSGYRNLTQSFLNDSELVSALEVYVPDAMRHISIPIKIAYRLFGHISDAAFNQQYFSGFKVYTNERGNTTPIPESNSSPTEDPSNSTSGDIKGSAIHQPSN
jgi:hypothetical protein